MTTKPCIVKASHQPNNNLPLQDPSSVRTDHAYQQTQMKETQWEEEEEQDCATIT